MTGKKHVSKIAQAVADAGKKFESTVWASVWADALELHSSVSDWARGLPRERAGRMRYLDAVWTAWKAAAAAANVRSKLAALKELMAAAAWVALDFATEEQSTN